MTPLIKNLLSLLAASGTAVGGGLLYTNREVIFRSLGWGGEEASNNVNSEGSLNSEIASGGQRENSAVVSGSDTLAPAGSTNSAVNPSSIESPAPVSVPSGPNPTQGSEAATQRPNGQGGESISVPGRTEGASQTSDVLLPIQKNVNGSVSDAPVVQNGTTGGPRNEEQRSEVTDPGTSSSNPSDAPSGDLASESSRESGQTSVPSPELQTTTEKDYQCFFGNDEYEDAQNKKDLKNFLIANGGGDQGLQILGPESGEFKCAKDAGNEELNGLKDYLETKKNNFSILKTKGEPLIWAVKKNGSNWTMEEENGDSLGAIKSTTVE